MKPANEITDRAKRYRANRNRPPGPTRCNFCGSRQNIDVDHISGDESDGAPENLIYLCRRCNSQKGVIQTRHRIGVRTVQFNPARGATLKQFQHDAAVLLGIIPGNVQDATTRIRATSPAKRALYAGEIAPVLTGRARASAESLLRM